MRAQIKHPIYKLNCDLTLMVLAAALDASELPMISQKVLFSPPLFLGNKSDDREKRWNMSGNSTENKSRAGKCPHVLA